MKAYVQLKVRAKSQAEVVFAVESLQKDGVPITTCDVIMGDYDIMVVVEHEDEKKVYESILKIAGIGAVIGTSSIMTMPRDVLFEVIGE